MSVKLHVKLIKTISSHEWLVETCGFTIWILFSEIVFFILGGYKKSSNIKHVSLYIFVFWIMKFIEYSGNSTNRADTLFLLVMATFSYVLVDSRECTLFYFHFNLHTMATSSP